MLDLQTTLILLATGLITGFINTVAGGGSLLTLPVFIFLGFPADMANGTNRVAILFSSFTSSYAFRKQGVRGVKYGIWLGLAAMAGAIPGAIIALKMDNELFTKVLAIIMFAVSIFILAEPFFKKQASEELQSTPRLILAVIAFFFVGVYGGFVQAGVGFLMIAALAGINRMNLVKANNIKVIVTFFLTIVALAIFAYNGKIDWIYGLVLAVGQSAGGWAGSVWSVKKGEKWIRYAMLVMIVVLGVKLLFY